MKTNSFTQSAAREFDGLPQNGRAAVEYGLIRYAISGEGDVKQLSGREGFRIRIGRYRVLFDENRSTILAVYHGKRETTTYRRN